MLENVSIIIPFQTDHGPRETAFEWLKRYYANVMPEAELCVGIIDDKEINKAKAVNWAAKRATRDIFAIVDADVVFDPKIIVEAIKLLDTAPCVIPFNEIYNVEKHSVKRLFKTIPQWPIAVKPEECSKANWIYEGFAGKLIVIPKRNFEAVGGFDERFIGWGGEDDAFSLSVQTICGKFANVKAKIFHLWHPPSSYSKNPNGLANGNLLNRYKHANGNKEEMLKLMQERNNFHERLQPNPIELMDPSKSSPKKICFAILVHENRDLVKQLIDNVRYYCPDSTLVLYNGGDDPNLCKGLGVPVCPSSRKLNRGWTTVYFLETMEWIEELGIQYEYFINIDSDALFFRKGYEKFIESEMKDTDYMAVLLRIPEPDWYIGNELRKDFDRWKELFNVNPFYGIFNVGQVMSRSLVKALLEPGRKEKLKKALAETVSFGTDEILFVNMAKELGFRMKKYPNDLDEKLIRYRPFFTLDEMMKCLNSGYGWLCHPIIRERSDPARRLILNMGSEHYTKKYKSREYPWYKDHPNQYAISLPIKSMFGNWELVVRSNSSLAHYWQHPNGQWKKSETFGEGVTGTPVFYENKSGQFAAVCKLKNGGVGFWWRDNKAPGFPWHGPSVILHEDGEPIMVNQLEDGRHIIVFESNQQFFYWLRDHKEWRKVIPS